jgi:hypothetical protein
VNRLSILKFDEVVRLWQQSNCGLSMPELLGLVADGQSNCVSAHYTIEELYERFRDTWWEVIRPNHKDEETITKGVQCRYVADSLPDALRNRPCIDFPNVEAKELLYACALEDETDDIEDDKESRYLLNC